MVMRFGVCAVRLERGARAPHWDREMIVGRLELAPPPLSSQVSPSSGVTPPPPPRSGSVSACTQEPPNLCTRISSPYQKRRMRSAFQPFRARHAEPFWLIAPRLAGLPIQPSGLPCTLAPVRPSL